MDDSCDAEGEIADAGAKQVHFTQDRPEDRKRLHGDADPNRRDEFNLADAGEKLVRMRENRIAGQQSQSMGTADVPNGNGPECPFIATENTWVEMQTRYQTENDYGDSCKARKRGQRLGTDEHVKILGGNSAKNRGS